MSKTYLLTRNVSQFRHYVHECGLNPRDAVYVHSVEKIRGIRNATLYLVGQWWEHPDNREIINCAKIARLEVVEGLPRQSEIADANILT